MGADGEWASVEGGGHLRVLFFLRHIGYDRAFEALIVALLERDHRVHVAIERERRRRPNETQLFDGLASRYPGFSHERLPRRDEPWLALATALRRALDYLRYLEPEFAGAAPLRERARAQAPAPLPTLLRTPPLRWRGPRRLLERALRRVESAIPVPASIRAYVDRRDPDVVLVAPLVALGSRQDEWLRAAAARGVPTVLPVASWDNLTNKGLIREPPTLTVVWNAPQVEEAVRLHRIPRERVAAVGAHTFDHWFGWVPGRSREELAAALGLDPWRPLLLYVCSSPFIAPDEPPFVREWMRRVRADPRLLDVAVIVRPHPTNVRSWQGVQIDQPGRTVLWPRDAAEPKDAEQKGDYFDCLHASRAVVGINTSALIEAAILRRPAFTLVGDWFPTQEGTLHFAHIGGEDGCLAVARSWEEHFDHLAAALATPAALEPRLDAFVRRFVRPHGLDRPAAPLAVEAIERVAAQRVRRRRSPAILSALFTVLTPLAAGLMKRRDEKGRSRDDERAKKPHRVSPARRKQRSLRKRLRDALESAAKPFRHAPKHAKRLSRALRHARRLVRGVYDRRWRFTYRRTIRFVPARNEIPALLNQRGLIGVGAEVGVKQARYSDLLLSRWRGSRLLSIDPWLAADPDEYVDGSNVSQPEFESYYAQARERLARHGQRSTIWRLTSLAAAARVPDRSLDFVYIDARHDYASVMEDLAAWFPKVRPGGIFAGHDYVDGVYRGTVFGVKRAVDEFFAARAIPVAATQGPTAVEMYPSWLVEIPPAPAADAPEAAIYVELAAGG